MRVLQGSALPSVPFVVCNADGTVIRVGSCPAQVVDLQASAAGEIVFAGALNHETEYIDVDAGQIVPKPPIAPLVSGLVVTGLPSPCTAVVEGVSHEIVGGEATFAFDVPGLYSVRFSAKNHLSAVIELEQP